MTWALHTGIRLALILAKLWILLSLAVFAIMWLPPGRFASLIAYAPSPVFAVLPFKSLWTFARAGGLRIGDPAPDFDLPLHDGSGRVRLSSHLTKSPVVLVFGSYT